MPTICSFKSLLEKKINCKLYIWADLTTFYHYFLKRRNIKFIANFHVYVVKVKVQLITFICTLILSSLYLNSPFLAFEKDRTEQTFVSTKILIYSYLNKMYVEIVNFYYAKGCECLNRGFSL